MIKHEHDSGYKNIFSKKHNFIHFLKKHINAEWTFALDKRSAREHMKRVLSVAAESLNRMSDDRNDILRWLRYIWMNHIKDEGAKNELLDNFEKGEINGMIYGIDRAFEEERIKGVNQGKIEGLTQDKLEGKLEGEITGKIKMAKKLLKRSFSTADIADITELSEDEILMIQLEMNEQS